MLAVLLICHENCGRQVYKFYRNLDIREKLLATGDKYLEEKNFWNDVFWGVDYKKGGENKLGKILMKVRECLRK